VHLLEEFPSRITTPGWRSLSKGRRKYPNIKRYFRPKVIDFFGIGVIMIAENEQFGGSGRGLL
jgi:hypothetical protein